jgi:hypothetical protein
MIGLDRLPRRKELQLARANGRQLRRSWDRVNRLQQIRDRETQQKIRRALHDLRIAFRESEDKPAFGLNTARVNGKTYVSWRQAGTSQIGAITTCHNDEVTEVVWAILTEIGRLRAAEKRAVAA